MRSPSFPLILLLALILGAGLSSCQEKKSISGRAFIKRDVLVDVLVDIHLSDAVSNDRHFYRKFEADSIDLLGPILDKYEISQARFDTTMQVYSQHPELLDDVYNDVLRKLNILLEENEKEEESMENKLEQKMRDQ